MEKREKERKREGGKEKIIAEKKGWEEKKGGEKRAERERIEKNKHMHAFKIFNADSYRESIRQRRSSMPLGEKEGWKKGNAEVNG